jgi:hypothetical protein
MNPRHLALLLLLLSAACDGDSGTSAEPPAGGTTSSGTAAAPRPGEGAFELVGRVVDPWGEAIAGAEVVVSGEGGVAGSVTTDAEGGYRLELPGPGPWSVEATHPEKGLERRMTGALAAGEPYRLPDLRIAGHGRLAGRLLDAAGRPLAATPVLAFSRSLLLEQCYGGDERFDLGALPLWAPKLESGYLVPREGFRHVATTTRADGGFVLAGLTREPQLLYSPALGTRAWWDPQREWVESGREDLELVSPLCQVVVAVGDDWIQGDVPDESGARRRVGAVEVFPAVPSAEGPKPLRGAPVYATEEANVFHVEPGDYVARATTYPPVGRFGATLHVEQRFSIEPGTAERRVELAFPRPDRPRGRLRVEAEVPEGWERPERFHLSSPLTALEIECSEFTTYPEPRYGEWLEVPEGEYLVALLPFEDFAGRPEVAELAPCRRRVVVRAGEDAEVRLVARPGGRLRIALGSDALELGRDLALPEGLPAGDAAALKGQFELALGLVIAAEREGGGPLVPLRLRDLGGVGIGERPRVLPGETITHFDMLEPGEWTLWAWSPAFELDALPATVRPGEVTSVELDLRVRR